MIALRARQQRNLLMTLLLSHGVPMLLGGDELGRTQGGNNNAWCQDNELSWYDWANADRDLLDLVRRLIQLRQTEPVFRRRDFLAGEAMTGSGLPDVAWLRPDGEHMADFDWRRHDTRALAVFLNGREIPHHDHDGRPIEGSSFLLLFNAYHEPITFVVPAILGHKWKLELATDPASEQRLRRRRTKLPVAARSVAVLSQR